MVGGDRRTVVGQASDAAFDRATIGYLVGREFDYRLLLHHSAYLRISESHIKLGQYLFLRHGGKIVLVGRFVPVLRSFAGILAGANRMPWPSFMLANVDGAIAWAAIYGLAAYFLGHQLKGLAEPLMIVLGCVAVVVAAAIFIRRHQAQLAADAERALPGPLRSPG
jgi:membrane protein DedA with SNARE-associated domain